MTQAVILAAGAGSRLRPHHDTLPKPLTAVGGRTLLERAIATCCAAGVTDVVVVLGYQADRVAAALPALSEQHRVRIRYALNDAWEQGNGQSVLAAEAHIIGRFFLMMCDHIVDSRFMDQLLAADDGVRACAVVVDRAVHCVPDLAEATKTRLAGPYVTAIGKALTDFDAVDTGVFLCRPALFDALRDMAAVDRHALSDAVQMLAECHEVGWADSAGLPWIDVDTPEDLRLAEVRLSGTARPARPGVGWIR